MMNLVGCVLKDEYSSECLGAVYIYKGREVTLVILGEYGTKLKVKGYFNTKGVKSIQQIKIIDKSKMKYLYKEE